MGHLNNRKFLIFIGKGGVGKTTCASATALGLAESGRNVLLASLDPAHNLSDVFGVPLSDSPTTVARNLSVVEVDIEKAVQRYLDQTARSMKNLYKYLTVFNLDKFIDVMKYAPGIEEYATLESIHEISERSDKHDFIIFDTAPTGLTLKVMTLPEVSLTWINQLVSIRKKILSHRSMIANIKNNKHEKDAEADKYRIALTEEDDKVLKELHAYHDEMLGMKELITGESRTGVIMVMNPDRLSLFETTRARELLDKFGISTGALILNKVLTMNDPPAELQELLSDQGEIRKVAHEKFRGVSILEIPYRLCHLRGREELDSLASLLVRFILPVLKN